MPFVKLVKDKAYFKRFQVKFRRRREGKTDYRARKRLVAQDKNKYNTPKYRFVVRISNKYVICQVICAKIIGDEVLATATSTELPRYGLSVGLKNYPATYCTGLLCARRLLSKLGMDSSYKGNEEVTGEIVKTEDEGVTYFVSEMGDTRPFRCFLDTGLANTTLGNRVFAALKGACDGGIDIPHNYKKFPGYDPETGKYDASFHRDRIFGQHVAEYMDMLEENEPETYKAHFAKFIEAGVSGGDLEGLYKKVHEGIRADPARGPEIDQDQYKNDKYRNPAKRSKKQRDARIAQKKAWHASKADQESASEEEEEDDE